MNDDHPEPGCAHILAAAGLAIAAITMAATLGGCAKTEFYNTTTNPDGSVTEWGGALTGDYGSILTMDGRNNDGQGGGGGLIGAILPGFGYKDSYTRRMAESEHPIELSITREGLTYKGGPITHSTHNRDTWDGINRGIRNVATYLGWLATMNTIDSVLFEQEITDRLGDQNATDVKLQELFTQEELAAIDANTTLGLAEIEAAP